MIGAFQKLDPRQLIRNPVIFVTEAIALLVTIMFVRDLFANPARAIFSGQIAAWLWFTVLFATFAEAVAEGRGKAQADSLRATKSQLVAKRLTGQGDAFETIPATSLKLGDVVLVEPGDMIPGDGEVVAGVALGQRERHYRRKRAGDPRGRRRPLGRDRRHHGAVGPDPGAHQHHAGRDLRRPHDRARSKAPNARRPRTRSRCRSCSRASTLVFLIAVVTLTGLAAYSGTMLTVTVLAALLVTLIPTTIGGLLSAIGIAGMDRLIRFNVIATSGRAVEAAGDVDTLLLDKTGTITFGNRMATEFLPVPGVSRTSWPRRRCCARSPTRHRKAVR